jgi:geranylgeranyl diphosphate synthase type II
MDVLQRIERALESAITKGIGDSAPPGLKAAVRHAVLTPGSRARPRLCLAVALACGDDVPAVSDAAAASIELLHCASLVHDDMPCFDDADTRRGQPTVHRAFGERLAVLAGDGLIVLAFENLAWHTLRNPERLAPLLLIIGRSVGMQDGIVAGQAWECETEVDLSEYHRMGQDAAHERPSATAELGLDGAMERLVTLIGGAVDSIPECPGRDQLRGLVLGEIQRLLPGELAARFTASLKD